MYTDSVAAYDIFAISIASIMLGYVYGENGALNSQQDLGIKVATPVGTLIGQLLFGWLADLVGRKVTSCSVVALQSLTPVFSECMV